MTLAAVTALSKSCIVAEKQHHRIAHLVLVRHFDEFFLCLLNPVSVIAVNGVDQTVHSPVILSPSRLNLVLAFRSPHGEKQVLVLNSLHFATDRCNGRHHFVKFQLVENRGLSCGIKLDHQNPRIGLANQALPKILAKAKPMATNTRRRASPCPVPPGREFSPELSASFIPSDVAVRRCSPQSVVCQQSARTRSRPRHAASAPAAATAATVASVLLLLLCNCNLLIPSAVFLGAPLR